MIWTILNEDWMQSVLIPSLCHEWLRLYVTTDTQTHRVRSIPCRCCCMDVFDGRVKWKVCAAGRNCSAGISAVKLPRFLVWELVRLTTLHSFQHNSRMTKLRTIPRWSAHRAVTKQPRATRTVCFTNPWPVSVYLYFSFLCVSFLLRLHKCVFF